LASHKPSGVLFLPALKVDALAVGAIISDNPDPEVAK